MEFTYTHPVNSYSAALWLHRQHPPGMPTCTQEKQSRILWLQFHTCYYNFMYNYIWLLQIKGWLHLSIMGIKKMPATCCNVITSCIRDTPLWIMWIHGRVQNISIKTPFRPVVPLFPMEIMLSDALIISDQGTWTATQFCCREGKCDTKKYCEIKISVNKPSWAIPTQRHQQ